MMPILPDAVIKEESVYCYSKKVSFRSPVEVDAIRGVFYDEILRQADGGMACFITDLKNEFQIIIAETILQVKEARPKIKLVVSMPYIFGYWGGPQWTGELRSRVRRLYNSADIKCVLDAGKIALNTNEATDAEHIRYMLGNCRTVLVYQMDGSSSKWLEQSIKDGNVRTVHLKNAVSMQIHLFQTDQSFVPWPEPRGELESPRDYFRVMGGRKSMLLHFTSPSTNYDHANRMDALKKLLPGILGQVVADGFEDFILSLENTLQITAGEIVLALKETHPQLRCVVWLPKRITAPDKEWGNEWNERAKKIYSSADIRGYFFDSEYSANTMHSYYFFLLMYVSEIICAGFREGETQATLSLYARLLNIKMKDLGWGLSKEVTRTVLNQKADILFDYIYAVTKSKLVVGSVKKQVRALSEEERLLLMESFFSNGKKKLSHSLKIKLSILDDYEIFGKKASPDKNQKSFF